MPSPTSPRAPSPRTSSPRASRGARVASTFALASLLTVAGCGRGGESKPGPSPDDPAKFIQGTWTVDVVRLAEQPHLAALPPEQRKLSLEMAQNVVGSMTVEFEGDHYRLGMGGKVLEGTFKTETTEGRKLTLSLTEADGEQDTLHLETSDQGLLFRPGQGEALPLKRR